MSLLRIVIVIVFVFVFVFVFVIVFFWSGYVSLYLSFSQVTSPHHSDQMSQRSQVYGIALLRCSLNVFVFVFVIVFVSFADSSIGDLVTD